MEARAVVRTEAGVVGLRGIRSTRRPDRQDVKDLPRVLPLSYLLIAHDRVAARSIGDRAAARSPHDRQAACHRR
jgi:hypothetical protein